MSKEFIWTDELVEELMEIVHNPYTPFDYGIEEFKKLKQPKPSFTTVDGVDIFKGDMYFLVEPNFYISKIKSWADDYSKSDTSVTFSTKEAAELYIIENKPCLSLKDLKEMWVRAYASGSSLTELKFYTQLTNLIKSRL